MSLMIFAIVGFLIGYRFEMTRAGYLAMAFTSIAVFAVQIVHVATTKDRASLTLLPMVLGFLVVSFMLLGALSRLLSRRLSKRG